ncbi:MULTISPECIES: PQQ-dependent sugar dehydrogenase [unclassified Arsukibacterium]|uniref:PQQ-dependent sugar dehydrogenase n=1 Tax=unclassified Arsukibacterium TaxID=2635278 RepID=UPI0025BBB383|nr:MULTISPECIES: PQQ-dependent sugar dehydrogenase [unclassified Arsukibacterium]|tara:strand:- start:602 stop:1729 length:1128 start_codon:yes stop_codon:yes gene_type:complete
MDKSIKDWMLWVMMLSATLLSTTLLSKKALALPYQVTTVAEELNYPWSLAFMADGSYLVTERTGKLKQLSADGALLAATAPALPGLYVAAQGGLLEVLLPAAFQQNQQLLLSYVCGDAKANTVCLASARWQQGQLTDIQQIFIAKPYRQGAAHYGGRMLQLPDGSVLLTLGDGFDYREQAQNPANHLGKIIRLQRDGAIPADNPFVGQAGVAGEIYSMGHRNVQGIVWDNATKNVYSHEHGPRGGDELNIIQPGKNYGWPVATRGIDYTGARVSPFRQYPGMLEPIWHWSPSIAPAGMTLYQGELFPDWQGDLFITALAGRALHRLQLKEGKVVAEHILLTERNDRLRDVRSGPDGALYLLTDSANGQLLRLSPQ